MRRAQFAIVVLVVPFALAVIACDSSEPSPRVSGTVRLLNGVTTATAGVSQPDRQMQVASAVANGGWRLTPRTMTMRITGVGFGDATGDQTGEVADVSNCAHTYDQTRPSLQPLTNCSFAVASGTYGSMTIAYSKTFDVVISDPAAGLWSDPASPTKLRATAPAGGAGTIQVTDQNGTGSTNYVTTYFATPVEVDSLHPPQLYVVFTPIHWMMSEVNGGVPGAPYMSGNPPIIAALTPFGKSEFYASVPTVQSYNSSASPCGGTVGPCSSFLVFYSDLSTAHSVTQVDGFAACNGAGTSMVSFNGNGLKWGTFGMLGLDAGGVLAWGLPGAMSSDFTSITGYRGVAQMNAVSSLGGTTTLSYLCTASPPQPIGGVNYGSGHPTFTATGTFGLTLVAR